VFVHSRFTENPLIDLEAKTPSMFEVVLSHSGGSVLDSEATQARRGGAKAQNGGRRGWSTL
jgi:hypothetical protein